MSDTDGLNLENDPFMGHGDMSRLIRTKDWSITPLGPVQQWPQSLRTAVSICLRSRFPIILWWGADYIEIYNDAYRPILGTTKHPKAMGQRGQETWAEIWPIIGPMLESVYRDGQATWSEDQMLPIDRHGFTEETYFTFSYSPIFDESGGIGGIFTAVTETTKRVLSERRLQTLWLLGERTSTSRSAREACQDVAAILSQNEADIPFAAIYLLDEPSKNIYHAASTGNGWSLAEEDGWPFSHITAPEDDLLIDDLETRFSGAATTSPGSDPLQRAWVLPLVASGGRKVSGYLVVGLSPRLFFDDHYKGFFKLIAGHISTAVANAYAYEEEQKRVNALAELDRAKTEFFSNVSHEFRTPLTLILSPLQELLGQETLSNEQREMLETIQRNSLRLLKLVNTLLDFSRIQAHRIQASYEAVDLSVLTTDLASSFRSAVERAGLRLIVDCPPLPELVYIDREMWEKIILNLLSNAFKFTFEGEIAVMLRTDARQVHLTIRDTGIGIEAPDLPRIFDRFHQVRGVRARTHEGSGIGLALVQEFVHFHGGDIRVESQPGQGTTFTISLQQGSAHLPPDHIGRPRPLSSPLIGVFPYVEEALRWVSPIQSTIEVSGLTPQSFEPAVPPSGSSLPAHKARVLIVDDNADMRDYLGRLLSPSYEVIAASDGRMALSMIEQRAPQLVVSDIMMPQLDGFGLLQQIRTLPHGHLLPVILLSARAGEEARSEGLKAGADDYLVKPFSIRELLASIQSNLKIVQLRQQLVQQAQAARAEIEDLIESIAEPFYALDQDWRFVYVNQSAQQMWHKTREELLGKEIWQVFPQISTTQAYDEMRYAVETQQTTSFETFSTTFQTWFEVTVYPNRRGLTVYFRDINVRKEAEQLRARLQAMFDQAVVGIVFARSDGRFMQANPGFCNMLGYTAEEIAQMSVVDITYPEDYATDMVLAAQVITGEISSYSIEKRYLRKDNSLLWVNLTSSIVRNLEGQFDYALGIVQDISPQKQAQAAAQSARALLDRERERMIEIFESISDAFVALDRDYRFIYLNPQAIDLYRRLTSQSLEYFLGQIIWEAFPGSYESPFGEAYRHAMQNKVFVQLEANFTPLNGWFEVRVYPSRDGLSIYFADVTAAYQSRQALQEAQDRLRLMIDSAKDYAIFAFDPAGRITNWNAGAERVFGYNEEILGQNEAILYTLADAADHIPEQERSKAAAVGYAETERWHRRKDDTLFYASGMVRPLRDEAGTLQGFTKVTRDTTLHQRAIQRTALLQRLAADLSAQLMIREMAETIIHYSLTAVGASMSSIYLFNPDEQRLERLVTEGFAQAEQMPYQHLSLSDSYPVTDAVRLGQMIWISNQKDYVARYPHLQDIVLQINIQAALLVPLTLKTHVLGALSISFNQAKVMSDEEQAMLVAVAHLCAQALERAQLYEQAQTAAALRERQRLARDLHDAVNQTLFSAMIIAQSLPRLWQRDPERVFPLLEQVHILNKAAAAEMRVLLWELRPEALEKTPLEDLYAQLTHAIHGRTQIHVSLDVQIQTPLDLPLPVHVAFYRIAQEAINNVVKHAQAKHLTLSLISLPDQIVLRVIDDGIGFTNTDTAGIGMGSMRERAEEIQATLTITSLVNEGTEIILIWPRSSSGSLLEEKLIPPG